MKFKLLYYILLLLPILLVSCSSFYWNRPVPYQEAITTQDQRLFKEKNSDTVLLVLVRDKSLETNSNLCIYLLKSLENDPLIVERVYRDKEYGYYGYTRIKRDPSRIVGCPRQGERILMHIPLNGKKERAIILALSQGTIREEVDSVVRKIFILRKGESQYYRWGDNVSESHDFDLYLIDPNK